MLRGVELSRDVLWGCTTHALTTEHEEILGLLLGTIQENTAYITRSHVLTRKVKLKDRVEVGYEDLASASELAEQFSAADGSYSRVVGWYHSHPHITVFPSHVDVRTQGQYQQLDQHFIGLIFSVFDKNINSVCAFQSLETAESGWQKLEIPLWVQPSPLSRVPEDYVSRRIDSFLSLQMEFLNENLRSFTTGMREASPLQAVEVSSAHTAALCSVAENMSLPLLMALRSKKNSMLQEKKALLAKLGAGGRVDSRGANSTVAAAVGNAESSSVQWKSCVEFIKIANEGMSLTVQLSNMILLADCKVRIVLASLDSCAEGAGGVDLGRCRQLINNITKNESSSAFFSPWICQYGSELASLTGISFSEGAAETGHVRARLQLEHYDTTSSPPRFEAVTLLFNKESEYDRRMEHLFRQYFSNSFVAVNAPCGQVGAGSAAVDLLS